MTPTGWVTLPLRCGSLSIGLFHYFPIVSSSLPQVEGTKIWATAFSALEWFLGKHSTIKDNVHRSEFEETCRRKRSTSTKFCVQWKSSNSLHGCSNSPLAIYLWPVAQEEHSHAHSNLPHPPLPSILIDRQTKANSPFQLSLKNANLFGRGHKTVFRILPRSPETCSRLVTKVITKHFAVCKLQT